MVNHNSLPIISCKSVSKFYDDCVILDNFSYDIYKGDVISVIGPSGSGKSTFLHLIAMLDDPNSGIISMPLFIEKTPDKIRKKHHFPYKKEK